MWSIKILNIAKLSEKQTNFNFRQSPKIVPKLTQNLYNKYHATFTYCSFTTLHSDRHFAMDIPFNDFLFILMDIIQRSDQAVIPVRICNYHSSNIWHMICRLNIPCKNS